MRSETKEQWNARVLHEQDGLLVIDKPDDLPSSGRDLEDPDCLQSILIERQGRMLWALHQLDADTSGLNLFVTEKRLVQVWKQRMAWPNCEKSYLTMLHGNPAWDAWHCAAPLGQNPVGTPPTLGVCQQGRAASTRFEVLARGQRACLARVRIETGRTHQIRIHAAHLGHALIGEAWYRQPACTWHHRQALHAHRLRFSGELPNLEWEAPLPPDFRALAAQLGLAHPLLAGGSDRPS